MKLITFIAAFILGISIFVSPYPALAADPPQASASAEVVDVYAVFWPVVPGKTVAEGMFWLKQLKETLGGMLTFGDINKAKYQIDISEKRFVEASKLFESNDYANALKSLDLNKAARDKALQLKKQAQEAKLDTLELTNRLVGSLEKQQKVLMSLETKLPDDQKAKIEEIIKDLTLQISEAK